MSQGGVAFTSRSGGSIPVPKSKVKKPRMKKGLKTHRRKVTRYRKREYSPENEDRFLHDDELPEGQFNYLDHGLFVPEGKGLDAVDKIALKRWRKNVKKARQKGQLR
jgi:hypothetical protein